VAPASSANAALASIFQPRLCLRDKLFWSPVHVWQLGLRTSQRKGLCPQGIITLVERCRSSPALLGAWYAEHDMCLEDCRGPCAGPVSKCLRHVKPSVMAVGKETAPLANSIKKKRWAVNLYDQIHVRNIVLRKIGFEKEKNPFRRKPPLMYTRGVRNRRRRRLIRLRIHIKYACGKEEQSEPTDTSNNSLPKLQYGRMHKIPSLEKKNLFKKTKPALRKTKSCCR